MKLATRILFGFNTVYQIAVGAISLLIPMMTIGFYKGPTNPDNFLMSAFRILGANMIFGGIISAYIAWKPDKNPVLLRLMGMLAALTLICWGVVYFQKELPLSTLVFDIIVQVLILTVSFTYKPKQ